MAEPVAVGVQATYDAIAADYDRLLGDELAGKPLDRAVLTAVVELAGHGIVADVGCGPGHVTRYLADLGARVVGVDLSPGMIDVARSKAPELPFTVASMLRLPVADAAWFAVVALYSVIHLSAENRAAACRELARVLGPGGWLLVAFHIDSAEFAVGETNHITSWFGHRVQLDGHFLDPQDVVADLGAAGFTVRATLERQPDPAVEHPSRRCYFLAQRG